MASREEFEAELTLSVSLLLKLKSRGHLYAGWLQLFERGIDPVNVAEGQEVPAEALQELLGDASSDADAFDACSTLAGLQVSAGIEVHPSLRKFAANTMLGKSSRPKRAMRSVGKGISQDITRYIILEQALRFFPMQKGKGLRTQDGTKTKAEYPSDAFETVAKALGEAGLPTTESQLKNLLRHPSKEAIRKIGKWAVQDD